MEIKPGEDNYETIFNFFDKQGKLWGCRKDVIVRVVACVNDFMESAFALDLTRGEMLVSAGFDELSLDVTMRYRGSLMVSIDEPPTKEELLEDSDIQKRLSGYLIHRLADTVKSTQKETDCTVLFHFEH